HDAALRAADAQLDVVIADIKRAQSQTSLASLQKNIDLAAERLKQSVVRAPADGKILKVMAHVGELVGTQPVFQLGDVTHMIAVAEVYETDVKTVRDWVRAYPGKVGADVEIRFPGAAPSKFHGIVERVADLVVKNSAFSADPRQDVDRRVVEVRIKLDDQFQKEAAEFVNMQVDVTIKSPKAG
ncbi:MAG: HlyD family efflux transporter periplasmic adaptor subunit, partial [Gemmataceae bacterium]